MWRYERCWGLITLVPRTLWSQMDWVTKSCTLKRQIHCNNNKIDMLMTYKWIKSLSHWYITAIVSLQDYFTMNSLEHCFCPGLFSALKSYLKVRFVRWIIDPTPTKALEFIHYLWLITAVWLILHHHPLCGSVYITLLCHIIGGYREGKVPRLVPKIVVLKCKVYQRLLPPNSGIIHSPIVPSSGLPTCIGFWASSSCSPMAIWVKNHPILGLLVYTTTQTPTPPAKIALPTHLIVMWMFVIGSSGHGSI